MFYSRSYHGKALQMLKCTLLFNAVSANTFIEKAAACMAWTVFVAAKTGFNQNLYWLKIIRRNCFSAPFGFEVLSPRPRHG